jgi:hypothetical protein
VVEVNLQPTKSRTLLIWISREFPVGRCFNVVAVHFELDALEVRRREEIAGRTCHCG